MENIEALNDIATAAYALRWVIAVPFVSLAAIGVWGWWNKITV